MTPVYAWLSPSFVMINKAIQALNIILRLEFYKPGQFKIEISAEEAEKPFYKAEGKPPGVGLVVRFSQHQCFGIVKASNYSDKSGKKTYILSGFLYEKELDNGIVSSAESPTYEAVEKNVLTVVRELFTKYRPEYFKGELNFANFTSNKFITIQETGAPLGEKLYSLLKPVNMSLRAYPLENVSSSICVLRLIGPSKTPRILLSDASNSISNIEYTYDETNYKTYFWVEGTDDIFTDYDIFPGDSGIRNKVYLSASSIKKKEGTSLKAYKESLKAHAVEKSNDYRVVENVTFDFHETGCVFGVDFDLGDVVKIQLTKLRKEIEKQITGAEIVYKNNRRSVNLSLGEPPITQASKAIFRRF